MWTSWWLSTMQLQLAHVPESVCVCARVHECVFLTGALVGRGELTKEKLSGPIFQGKEVPRTHHPRSHLILVWGGSLGPAESPLGTERGWVQVPGSVLGSRCKRLALDTG